MRKIITAVTICAVALLCGCDSLFNDVQEENTLPSMIRVSGGTFQMGWEGLDGATPVHDVTLSDYSIGTTEVTYDQWLKVYTWALANEYVFDNEGRQGGESGTSGPIGNNQHPVTNICWQDAVVWCNALSEMNGLTPVYYSDNTKSELFKDATVFTNNLDNDSVAWEANGYRLPTEAEWEYAARKMSEGYSNGDEYSGYDGVTDEPRRYAWYLDNADGTTQVVAIKDPNWLDIYDMSGNVWEYCWDHGGTYTSDSQINPKGPNTSLDECITRGGSWGDDWDDTNTYMATSDRTGWTQHSYDNATGFRIARNAE